MPSNLSKEQQEAIEDYLNTSTANANNMGGSSGSTAQSKGRSFLSRIIDFFKSIWNALKNWKPFSQKANASYPSAATSLGGLDSNAYHTYTFGEQTYAENAVKDKYRQNGYDVDQDEIDRVQEAEMDHDNNPDENPDAGRHSSY